MTTFQDLTFFWGETWPLEFEAEDQDGDLIVPAYVSIRVGSATGLIFDFETPDPIIGISGSSVQAWVTLASQAFPPVSFEANLTYEVRAGDTPWRAYTQMAGCLRIRPSLYGTYAWIPPINALLAESGGYLPLEQGGVLLLETG